MSNNSNYVWMDTVFKNLDIYNYGSLENKIQLINVIPFLLDFECPSYANLYNHQGLFLFGNIVNNFKFSPQVQKIKAKYYIPQTKQYGQKEINSNNITLNFSFNIILLELNVATEPINFFLQRDKNNQEISNQAYLKVAGKNKNLDTTEVLAEKDNNIIEYNIPYYYINGYSLAGQSPSNLEKRNNNIQDGHIVNGFNYEKPLIYDRMFTNNIQEINKNAEYWNFFPMLTYIYDELGDNCESNGLTLDTNSLQCQWDSNNQKYVLLGQDLSNRNLINLTIYSNNNKIDFINYCLKSETYFPTSYLDNDLNNNPFHFKMTNFKLQENTHTNTDYFYSLILNNDVSHYTLQWKGRHYSVNLLPQNTYYQNYWKQLWTYKDIVLQYNTPLNYKIYKELPNNLMFYNQEDQHGFYITNIKKYLQRVIWEQWKPIEIVVKNIPVVTLPITKPIFYTVDLNSIQTGQKYQTYPISTGPDDQWRTYYATSLSLKLDFKYNLSAGIIGKQGSLDYDKLYCNSFYHSIIENWKNVDGTSFSKTWPTDKIQYVSEGSGNNSFPVSYTKKTAQTFMRRSARFVESDLIGDYDITLPGSIGGLEQSYSSTIVCFSNQPLTISGYVLEHHQKYKIYWDNIQNEEYFLIFNDQVFSIKQNTTSFSVDVDENTYEVVVEHPSPSISYVWVEWGDDIISYQQYKLVDRNHIPNKYSFRGPTEWTLNSDAPWSSKIYIKNTMNPLATTIYYKLNNVAQKESINIKANNQETSLTITQWPESYPKTITFYDDKDTKLTTLTFSK